MPDTSPLAARVAEAPSRVLDAVLALSIGDLNIRTLENGAVLATQEWEDESCTHAIKSTINCGEPVPPDALPDALVRWMDRTPQWRYATTAAGAEAVIEAMGERGRWADIRSPWLSYAPHDHWKVGFTPHGTTGWNGRPDHVARAPTFARAVAEAAILALHAAGALPSAALSLLSPDPTPRTDAPES